MGACPDRVGVHIAHWVEQHAVKSNDSVPQPHGRTRLICARSSVRLRSPRQPGTSSTVEREQSPARLVRRHSVLNPGSSSFSRAPARHAGGAGSKAQLPDQCICSPIGRGNRLRPGACAGSSPAGCTIRRRGASEQRGHLLNAWFEV